MGDTSHTEQPPALGSGGSFKSSVPMSLMGTQTTGRKESGGQAVVVASPHHACPPAGAPGCPLQRLPCKLSSRLSLGTSWAQGPGHGADKDGVEESGFSGPLLQDSFPHPALVKSPKTAQGSPAACLPHSLSRESQHTIQAQAQGQHGVPLTQSPNSPVPVGNHPFHLL